MQILDEVTIIPPKTGTPPNPKNSPSPIPELSNPPSTGGKKYENANRIQKLNQKKINCNIDSNTQIQCLSYSII